MLKQTLRTLFLFTLLFVSGSVIAFINNNTGLQIVVIILSMLGVLFAHIVKLVKSMEG